MNLEEFEETLDYLDILKSRMNKNYWKMFTAFYRAFIILLLLFLLLRDSISQIAVLFIFIIYSVTIFYTLLMLLLRTIQTRRVCFSLMRALIEKEIDIKSILSQIKEFKKIVLWSRFVDHVDLNREVYGSENYLEELKAFYEES